MELKLNVYTERNCKEVEKTYTTSDFVLSVGACEDVLGLINIDMFEGGLQALSDESQKVELVKMVLGAFPAFKDILKDVFDGLNDDELKRTDISEIVKVVKQIVTFAFSSLAASFGGSKKN